MGVRRPVSVRVFDYSRMQGVVPMSDIYATVAKRVFGELLFTLAITAVITDEARRAVRKERNVNLCANGKPGFADGEFYVVKNPCTNAPLVGHIFCDACRKEAGGYAR